MASIGAAGSGQLRPREDETNEKSAWLIRMADFYDILFFFIRVKDTISAYNSNAYLGMLRTSHNKICTRHHRIPPEFKLHLIDPFLLIFMKLEI